MLVLSRKKLESIRIADQIEVVVLDIGRNRVRLGFKCPPHISIKREELCFDVEVSETPHPTEVNEELVCA